MDTVGQPAAAQAAVVAAVGDQVEAFIAAVGLGLTTALTGFLLVPLESMYTAVPLPAIGLMPSQTHCCACATGWRRYQASFHLLAKLPVIMVGLVAEGGLHVNQGHIPAATEVLAVVVAQAEAMPEQAMADSVAAVDVANKARLAQMPIRGMVE